MLCKVAEGVAQADTIIRGQHEQLTGAMDREQKTKRELVSLATQDWWRASSYCSTVAKYSGTSPSLTPLQLYVRRFRARVALSFVKSEKYVTRGDTRRHEEEEPGESSSWVVYQHILPPKSGDAFLDLKHRHLFAGRRHASPSIQAHCFGRWTEGLIARILAFYTMYGGPCTIRAEVNALIASWIHEITLLWWCLILFPIQPMVSPPSG